MKSIVLILFVIASYTTVFSQRSDNGSVSRGKATIVSDNLFPNCKGSRPSRLGTSTSLDGKTWTVPSSTSFLTGPYLSDLYNECSNVTPASIANVNLESFPITIIDSSGDIINGYILSDNYCELYINGKLVGVDPVPYTPFNACIVRFKVKRPYTIAVKLVDWEENSGLGTENNGGNPYHAGDGGFIANFSDGTRSDSTWKAQVYYISPVMSGDSVITLSNNIRYTYQSARNIPCADSCYAVHYPIPETWMQPTFNDNDWPYAFEYTPSVVGVNWPAWTNFPTVWNNRNFIWTSNLVTDNEVLLRKTIGSISSIDRTMDYSDISLNLNADILEIESSKDINDITLTMYSVLGETLASFPIPFLSSNGKTQFPMNTINDCMMVMLVLEQKGIPLQFKQCILQKR